MENRIGPRTFLICQEDDTSRLRDVSLRRFRHQPGYPHRTVGKFPRGVETRGNECFDAHTGWVSDADQSVRGKHIRGQFRQHAA